VWQVLGGTFTSNPSCAASNFGNLNRVICAAIAPDSTLQGIRFNPPPPASSRRSRTSAGTSSGIRAVQTVVPRSSPAQ
jgi:hypothetical protein